MIYCFSPCLKIAFILLSKYFFFLNLSFFTIKSCGGCCGVSMLLRDGGHWDYLINLGAFEYPLIT
ncbi:hypothetical protein Hanom_Chr13g01203721 [Helianthus anomalus]